MIGLEHVNLVVKDIEEMLKFYQAAFPTLEDPRSRARYLVWKTKKLDAFW